MSELDNNVNLNNLLDLSKISDKILLVDDDKNLLASIKRQFHKKFNIDTASSGLIALDYIEKKGPYAVIISDMQMPEMDGIEFLSQACEVSDKSIRIMLTGNANQDVAIDGINRGNLFRFLNKPVSKELLHKSITDGLNQYRLIVEREQMFSLINSQNDQLMDLNNNLERKVKQRTAELASINKVLKKQHFEVTMAFSKIIELYEGINKGHAKQIAQKSTALGEKLGMDKSEIQNMFIAALLLQIGKLSLPEKLLGRPFFSLNKAERMDYLHHAVEGQSLLNNLEHLQHAAYYIRCQYERYNGTGIPDALKGNKIPLASRILTVIQDYFSYLDGTQTGKKMLVYQVYDILKKNSGRIYDPKVVDLFTADRHSLESEKKLETIKWLDLKVGMRVFEVRADNLLLLKNKVITQDDMEKIEHHRSRMGNKIEVKRWIKKLS